MTSDNKKNHEPGISGDILYSCPGMITDKSKGWKFIPSANPGGAVYNEAEGYYPDKGGQLLGPSVSTCRISHSERNRLEIFFLESYFLSLANLSLSVFCKLLDNNKMWSFCQYHFILFVKNVG